MMGYEDRPTTINCQRCGVEVPVFPTGAVPRFCKPCRHLRETDRKDRVKKERTLMVRNGPVEYDFAQHSAHLRTTLNIIKPLLLVALATGDMRYVQRALMEIEDNTIPAVQFRKIPPLIDLTDKQRSELLQQAQEEIALLG